jgi:hypothetical protein
LTNSDDEMLLATNSVRRYGSGISGSEMGRAAKECAGYAWQKRCMYCDGVVVGPNRAHGDRPGFGKRTMFEEYRLQFRAVRYYKYQSYW